MKNLWLWWKLEIRNHSLRVAKASSFVRYDSKSKEQFIDLYDPQWKFRCWSKPCRLLLVRLSSFRFDFVSILCVSLTAQWTSMAQQFTVSNSYLKARVDSSSRSLLSIHMHPINIPSKKNGVTEDSRRSAMMNEKRRPPCIFLLRLYRDYLVHCKWKWCHHGVY